MKIVFNDATELQVQSVYENNGKIVIKTISADIEELRKKFSDILATRKMDVYDFDVLKSSYEGYTELYRLEEYNGKIFGVVLYKTNASPENVAKTVLELQTKNVTIENEIKEIVGVITFLKECMKKILSETDFEKLLETTNEIVN